MSCEVPGENLRIKPSDFPEPAADIALAPVETVQTAVLAGGCFWCVDAVFRQLKGVLDVRSGYAGGTPETADYRTVCTGATDHAEVIEVRFDASQTSFGQLLKVFFSVAHDPTQLDRQGNDRGRQYRSAIFYAGDQQLQVAKSYIRQLNEAAVFTRPIVTRLEPLEAFYAAEDYHQDYAARNPQQPYVAAVATPKVEKLHKYFPDRLKK